MIYTHCLILYILTILNIPITHSKNTTTTTAISDPPALNYNSLNLTIANKNLAIIYPFN